MLNQEQPKESLAACLSMRISHGVSAGPSCLQYIQVTPETKPMPLKIEESWLKCFNRFSGT